MSKLTFSGLELVEQVVERHVVVDEQGRTTVDAFGDDLSDWHGVSRIQLDERLS
jgi:hypothetical protein